MASGTHVPCGPCRYDDVTKDAKRWCTSCEEGLCEDCENVHRKSKVSRNHQVISIQDYRKIENVSVSQVCEHHGEKLEWFYKSHEEVLCMVCVPSKHKTCSNIISLSIASTNSRQSTALSDLEMAIEGTLQNTKQFILNRESGKDTIEKQESMIETVILETRTNINSHLDKIQEKLLRELRSSSHTCSSKYMKFLEKLESTKKVLTTLKEQTLYMKQYSSDIQVFLGTRQGNQRIASKIGSIKSEICATKDFELKVAIHSLIDELSRKVDAFGQINVSECTSKLDFRDQKIDQAQMKINVPTSRSIFNVKLQLNKAFQIRRKYKISIRDCVILYNGHILIANNTNKNKLFQYSNTGEHIRDIEVSANPFHISVIDPDRIVVSYQDEQFIDIMSSNSFIVEKKIGLQHGCSAISVTDGRLYIVSADSTIKVLDLARGQMDILTISTNSVLHITTSRDKIFYTEFNKDIVHCLSLKGEPLWQFKNESLVYPCDLAVDNYNNVYVLGVDSCNLIIVQPDGKNSKTLLTIMDGLVDPTAVCFDKEKRTLLICCTDGQIGLYNVV